MASGRLSWNKDVFLTFVSTINVYNSLKLKETDFSVLPVHFNYLYHFMK